MKKLNINGLIPRIPLIQGGMAVGISLDRLASAVANEGGIGMIGTAGLGMLIEDYKSKNFHKATIEGLKQVIKRTREKTDGIFGVNIMVALSNFMEMAATAIKEGVDLIVSGAGLPLELPSLLEKNSRTKLVPIVSSAKAAKIICRNWKKKYDCFPDAFVVEGPKAGGHLGYTLQELEDPSVTLESILPKVCALASEIEKENGKIIPVIAAGGIFDKNDVERVFNLGASGVQVGTPFIATEECDADEKFKEYIINAREEDLRIIKSPVGLPGRVVNNKFIEEVTSGQKKPITCNYQCITTCDFMNAPYCIGEALLNAAAGDLDNGFCFAGVNAYKINEITTVKKVIERLFEL